MNLISQFDKLKSNYNQKLGQFQALKERVVLCQDKIVQLTDKEDTTLKASLFLQSLSDQTRLQVLDKISGIVTDALQTVKDRNLEFKMNLIVKANQPTLEMGVLDKSNGQVFDILNSMGGGVADAVSFVLRVALLTKWQPKLSRIIIADEAFKHVSVKDQEKVAEFIRILCEKLSLQLILISHSETITKSASKIFEIIKENGISKVVDNNEIRT